MNKLQQLEQEIWIKLLDYESSTGNSIKINRNPAELEESINQKFKYYGSSYHYENGCLYKIIVNMLGNKIIIEEYTENDDSKLIEEFNLKYNKLLCECPGPTNNTIVINDNPNKYYNGLKSHLDKLYAVYIFDETNVEVIKIIVNVLHNKVIIELND